ncbi:MAG: biotin/lipoyl-binding protein [Chloroherpetonaceae bacterium]|nr:biotin/lipoyl-binding protein [Chthonomonadaceae bacterium]MDW8206940.1 biotin/lipoyl-binding protein [Chloroherpetonaceae bacterium]
MATHSDFNSLIIEAGAPSRSLLMVAPKPWVRPVALTLIFLILTITLGLIYIPWQQSVTGTGQVIIYSAMERPQNIEAQIPGRLVSWEVQEGQEVRKGQIIARLEDIEQRFLDPEQPRRLRAQRAALIEQRRAAQNRIRALKSQYAFLTQSRSARVPTASELAKQAEDQLRRAQQILEATRKSQQIARDAAVPAAEARLRQAEEALRREREALTQARKREEIARIQRQRIAELFARELRSQREDELAEQDLVLATTGVQQAEAAVRAAQEGVEVAKQELKRARLLQEQADADVARAAAEVEAARRARNAGALGVQTVDADTAAQLNTVEASLAAAQETVASITNSIIRLDQDLMNLERRVKQQLVVAPRDGRIVRLMRVGAGETVKAGDVLAVLAPRSSDQAVELFLSDNDAPLVSVGRKVRLQFAGWPALQFTGWPSVAVGTFAGKVAVIDAIDDGTSSFRIIVKPDWEQINNTRDEPWPPLERLRPGAKVVGWVMLDQVSLGFELWRQFNAFPPTVDRQELLSDPDKEDKSDKDAEKPKAKSGVKRRAKNKF